MSLNNLISQLNKLLVDKVPQARTFGVCRAINRTQGSVSEVFPGYIDPSGEIRDVSIDDVYPTTFYHKVTSITTTRPQPTSGYGDGFSDTVNTYACSLFVLHMLKDQAPEDMFLMLQSAVPAMLPNRLYKKVLFSFTNAVLNVEQVFASEYRGGEFRLPADRILFQINYILETTHAPHCFEVLCPE